MRGCVDQQGWPGLHRSSTPPWVRAPSFSHGHAGVLTLAHHHAHRHEEKRHSLTRDQPSIFEKKPLNTNTATYAIFAYLLNKKLWPFKAQSLITQHIFV